jgi:hypothetical protein
VDEVRLRAASARAAPPLPWEPAAAGSPGGGRGCLPLALSEAPTCSIRSSDSSRLSTLWASLPAALHWPVSCGRRCGGGRTVFILALGFGRKGGGAGRGAAAFFFFLGCGASTSCAVNILPSQGEID